MVEENTQEQELAQKKREEDRAKIRVKTYFNEKEFAEIIADSVQGGFRRVGLKPFLTMPSGRKKANTKKISQFLKFCWREWRRIRAEGRDMQTEIETRRRELAELERQAGLGRSSK